ncbi:phosphoribosyl-ATP diphosphatase [Candidatus Vidania fulgoroideae]|uniref:phosphoribosyl-ATP diphosphatase n=1 Tax=Candidatus Vidania fulgoroideorum TaxID=881286 RepID=A0A975ADL8_9PROT|nr:phosphoribosyl-ATP diphosphatase [Candidatus Vidania fulgoroideae]
MITSIYNSIKQSLKSPAHTYCKILAQNTEKLRRKVLEEAYELIKETLAKPINKHRMVNEFCDLLFHITMVIYHHKIHPKQIKQEMFNRKKPN